MTDDINKKIKKAFSDITPDIFDSIRSQCNEQKGSAVIMTTNKKNNFKKILSIAAVIALILGSFGVFGVYQSNNAVKSVISLDVNPSIEIKLNKNEKVLDVVALNEDAQKIIGAMDFKNNDLTITINALVGSMLRNGYLTDVQNSILVTVDGNDHEKNAELQKKIDTVINDIFVGSNIEGAVLSQENEKNDEITVLAEKHNISEGKAQLAYKLSEELTNHNADELAELSINELNILAEKTENVHSHGTASKKAYIGEEKALEAAFKKANVKADDAKNIEIELDSDHGTMVYEIEFWVPPYEYDVEVNAVNGEILVFDKETEKIADSIPEKNENTEKEDTGANKPVQNTAPVGTTKNAVTYLPSAKIKAIALKKAGVSENEITNYRAEFDKDDGIAIYEVSFEAANYEYDVDINAVTGTVLDFDKEPVEKEPVIIKPAQPTTTTVTSENTVQYIAKAKAKTIALNKAGVKEAELVKYNCEFGKDDGVAIYEISFETIDYEYDVEINAVTGAIIDFDKEVENNKPVEITKPATTKPATTRPAASDTIISKEKAKEIALNHAGVPLNEIRGYSCEYDTDDGVKVYEIEFKHKGYEYSYEIDAVTGRIIDSEKESD